MKAMLENMLVVSQELGFGVALDAPLIYKKKNDCVEVFEEMQSHE